MQRRSLKEEEKGEEKKKTKMNEGLKRTKALLKHNRLVCCA
jgi:hypothetical protein